MSKISAIIPTYNAAQYICETIDSALAQTYLDLEIIVIDDGSTDETQQILKKYGDKIKYIYQKNNGVSAARNNGIREAKGEYIALLDSDDIWLPDKIKGQISLAEQNPDIDLFFSDAEIFNDKGVLQNSSMPSHTTKYPGGSFRDKITGTVINDGFILKGNFYIDLLMGNLVTISTVFMRKECLEEIGCFDEKLSANADYDLWMRVARSHSLLYHNNVTTRYRLRDDSMSGKVNLRGFFFHTLDSEILEKQLRDCPAPQKELIKMRILECYKTAIWGYYNFMEFKQVRKLCLRSLYYDKFQLKLYLYLMATLFPPGLIKSRTPLE